MIPLDTISGLLVAGGRSRRFGAEKALAPFAGAPMMDHAAILFAELPAFSISARPGSGAEARGRAHGVEVLFDDPTLPSGPLAGVLSGLAWARRRGYAFLATAPCDAPRLPANLAPKLAANIAGARGAFAQTDTGQHPLCALWSIELYDVLEARLRSGEHPAVRRFLAEVGARAVHFEEARAFANANTVEDLTALQRPA